MEKPMVTKCHVHHNHLKPAKSENLKKWKSLEQIYTYEWPELQGQCNALVTQQPKCGFENARACLWRERANSTWSKTVWRFTIYDLDRFWSIWYAFRMRFCAALCSGAARHSSTSCWARYQVSIARPVGRCFKVIPGAVESHGKSEADSVRFKSTRFDKAHEALGISWDILGSCAWYCAMSIHFPCLQIDFPFKRTMLSKKWLRPRHPHLLCIVLFTLNQNHVQKARYAGGS